MVFLESQACSEAIQPCFAHALANWAFHSNWNGDISRPWKLPFIGNLHNLIGSVPHRALHQLSLKHGPLMHVQLGELSTIVVSSPESAKEVMKTHDIHFASRPSILVAEIISYNCTSITFGPSISSKEGSVINLTEKLYSSTYDVVSMAALGKKTKEQETLLHILGEVIVLAAGFDIGDLYPSIKLLQMISGLRSRLMKLHQQADKILEGIIHEHKLAANNADDKGEKQQEDLLDVLLKFQDDGLEIPLTSDNIKSVLVVSFFTLLVFIYS
ncbi:hypothetical protein BUALT_Bualt03G0107200 [Buddleja alternifolia]|uniref:Uncharacterized protein n=1 Tax=Buddleja alternifolia TaxID=168488 RepID=A0AAV6XSQ3_9LAMI|nr:hypothetical protein BUALT_Bualt03G0107200 [Buddleja alternifolia]